jgi:peptide/nickel transport system substrate-binding protein
VGFPYVARDPSGTLGVRSIASHLQHERLFLTQRDGRPRPILVERWELTDGGLGVRLHLRPGLRFQDGSTLDAAAVRDSLTHTLADTTELIQYPTLRDIQTIVVETPQTLRLGLTRRSALLLDDLEVPIVRRLPDGGVIRAGAFVPETESADATILRANPRYLDGPPLFETVELKPYPSVRTAWAAMMRGELDALYEVPNDAREFIEKESSVRVIPTLRPYVYTVVFNMRRPQFRSQAVRQALNLAVDRQALVDTVLRGYGRPAGTNAWPEHWLFGDRVQAYGFEPERAYQLLTDSGLDVRRAAGRRPGIDFTCLVPAGVSPHEELAVAVQKQLFDVGIDMAIEPVPIPQLVERLGAGQFDAVLLDLNGGPALVRLYTFWHSSRAAFYGDFGYQGADEALDALRNAADDEARGAAALRLSAVMHDDPPALFLCWPENARAVSRRFDAGLSEGDTRIGGQWRWLVTPRRSGR